MRAVQVSAFTGSDRIGLIDGLPEPDPGDGVVIAVAAAGISFPDLLLSRGEYQIQPEPPFTPGLEAAGTVLRAAPASGFAAGDRVCAFTFGAWAEQVAAPAGSTFHLPQTLSFAQGAGLVLNYQTAVFGLQHRGRLQAGETVVVHGAAGGVGTAAVQVAKGLGAHVIAVASTPQKAAVAEAAGADQAIGDLDGWREQVLAATDGHGAHLVYDPVGGARTDESIRALRPDGRLVVIGFADGAIPQVALNRVLLRNIDVVGAAWGHYVAGHPEVSAQAGRLLERLVDQGAVAPVVGRTYPFADAAVALADLDARRATGKLVLEVSAHA